MSQPPPLHPSCALRAASTFSCLTGHQNSHKYHLKIYGSPSTGTPSLCVVLRASLRVRFRWWPSAKAAVPAPALAELLPQPPGLLTLSPLVTQWAQGAQHASTGLLGFTPLLLSYSSVSVLRPVRRSKNRRLESILLQFLRSLSRTGPISESHSYRQLLVLHPHIWLLFCF